MNTVKIYLSRIWPAARQPEFLFFFIAVWALIILFSNLSFGDLSGYDDAAYAHEAKTLLQTGDWWTLKLNGLNDFDKPPLFIWLLTLSFKILGVTDFAAKVPGALLGWATIILVYFLVKELVADESENHSLRKWLPPLAMLCLATTQYFLKYSTHAMTDVPFTFFFTLAIYFYVRALKNKYFLPAGGIAIGLATMMRSPVGFFPLAIIGLHLIYIRRTDLLFSVYFAGCVFFALAIPATWFAREYYLYGDSFIQAHFANVLSHSEAVRTRTSWQQFLWYFEYLFLIVKLYFPWFPLMFYGLFLVLRKMRVEKVSLESLLVIWFFAVLLPFSLVDSKVLRYILPVFPAFSILTAYSLQKIISPKFLPKFAQIALSLLFLAAVVSAGFPNYLVRGEDMRQLAPVSDAAMAPDEKILLYTAGEYQWNYKNQLLWYGNRLCEHVKDLSEVEAILDGERKRVVVMDKNSFVNLEAKYQGTLKVLGETQNFVCFLNH